MSVGYLLPWLLVSAMTVAGPWHEAYAQNGPDGTAAQLQHTVDNLKSREGLDAAVRDRAAAFYDQAITALRAAAERSQKTEELRRQAATAPETLARLQRQLAQIEPALTPEAAAELSTAALAERTDMLEERLAENQARLADLRSELTHIAQRPAEARDELEAARTALRQLDTAFDVDDKQADVVDDAQAALVAARRKALEAKIEYLEQVLTGLDRRERVLEARRALTQSQLERDNRSLAVVQAAFAGRQTVQASALRARSKARAQHLALAAGVVTRAAELNAKLALELTQVTRRGEALAAYQARLRDQVEDLQRRLNLVQRQLKIGGASAALGDVLRAQKRKLAAVQATTLEKLSDLPEIAAVELSAFQLQQRLARLEDPGAAANRLIDEADASLTPEARQTLVDLLEQRRDIVAPLTAAKNRFVETGRDLRSLSEQYENTVTAFGQLLDERLFWLPSFEPIDWRWFVRLAAALPWVFDPDHWVEVARALASGVRHAPFVAAFGLVLFVLLMAVQPALRRQLRRAAEPVGNVSNDTFWFTLRALAVTALLCLPWALLLALAGLLITRAADGATAFALAAGAGLVQLAKLILFLEPFRQVCRPSGLAQSHFHWSDEARQGLRRNLRRLLFALAVPTFFVGLTETLNDDAYRETIGRATFIFGSLTLAWFAWRLLHPDRGVLTDVLGAQGRKRWRLGYLWLPPAAGVPLILAGLAAWGYYYTSLQLESRFFFSAGLLGTSIILYSLIVRWLTVAERRLALARARRKREEAREARATREAAAAAGESTPDNLDPTEIDLIQITEQTRGLIKVAVTLMAGFGLWLLWSNMLPALGLLNDISLWQYATEVDGETQLTQVTLGALLLALVVGVFTALAGRNLPGFLEITVLRRFSLEAGSRYAMATLFQYAIVLVGLLVAVNLIGFNWSSIQWLVAAVGVGLGFGLQEIFANFVSGLVILFERPVRVGDTVTVGTLTGTVSRIRIRATTITDWDNKEVIIPNKTFITETVVNWTLTDAITRLIVRVSVARDADTDLAEDLITRAIRAEPAALEEPASSVFIVGFDDGQVVFEARVFFYDLYYLLPLQHALYRRIKTAFAENEIEISFPQQDLHVRSVDESARGAFSGRMDATSDAT